MKSLSKTPFILLALCITGLVTRYELGVGTAVAAPPANLNVAPGDVLYANDDNTKGKTDYSIGVHHGNSEVDQSQQDPHADESKALFLSPDKKTLAVTMQPANGEGDVLTYLANPGGDALTKPEPGSFVSWAPDSSKAYLFLSDTQNASGRAIYQITPRGEYQDAGFPTGTIAIDTNPVDGSVVYALTKPGTDEADLWMRSAEGKDSLFVTGDDQTFVWLRWSPTGKTLAYMVYDNAPGKTTRQSLRITDAEGSGTQKVDEIVWDYPPVWSPDGATVAYAQPEGEASNIVEYRPATGERTRITQYSSQHALQPGYAADSSLFFLSDQSGPEEVWRYSTGSLSQVTKTGKDKRYPVSL